MALSALGVGPGQEVIVPAYMWVAVAGAAINHGAIPVLADIDDTFCLDPRDLERRITPKTTGIMMVHMSGAPGDVEAVEAIAKKKGLWLIEDCAQCAGGTVGGRRVGTFGDIATFSFQINKNMTSGEGGCVITNDERLYRRAFASHDLGYARNEAGRLILDDPSLQIWGRGYRMDEMRAAVLRVQLRRLPETIAAMRASKHRVRAALERFEAVRLRRLIDPAGDTGCFLITTYRDAGTARRVSDALRAEGIRTAPQGVTNIVMTRVGAAPLLQHPEPARARERGRRRLPVAPGGERRPRRRLWQGRLPGGGRAVRTQRADRHSAVPDAAGRGRHHPRIREGAAGDGGARGGGSGLMWP